MNPLNISSVGVIYTVSYHVYMVNENVVVWMNPLNPSSVGVMYTVYAKMNAVVKPTKLQQWWYIAHCIWKNKALVEWTH